MNEWINKWMNKWINEWMNEWMNKWMNKLVCGLLLRWQLFEIAQFLFAWYRLRRTIHIQKLFIIPYTIPFHSAVSPRATITNTLHKQTYQNFRSLIVARIGLWRSVTNNAGTASRQPFLYPSNVMVCACLGLAKISALCQPHGLRRHAKILPIFGWEIEKI